MTSENYRNERSYQKYFMEGVYNLSGWSPFLHHLKGYYASHDKFRTIVDDHYEHQLSMKHYYVNLVLVTEDCHTEVVENLRVEENSREREERYQAMLLSGQTLGVEELYRDLNRSEEAGWISIKGRAGTGKTTLLQYISHCWGAERKGAWHNRFDFVFRVQLNLLKGYTDKKDLTTLEMLRQIILESFEKTNGYDEVLSKDNIDGCLKEKSFRNRILLLLDGFDEIQGLYNDNHKHIKDFIDDVMRQFPNGMMATRPDVLPKTLLTKFKHQYENVGFSVDNVYQYVDKYFQVDELEHKESLLAALHANPEMVSLAQVPIHAHILCLIWKGNAEKLSNTHLTMTQLYHELMLWLMKRYCYKFKSLTEKSPKQLFSICAQEITTLCEIAYNAFVDNNVQFIKGDFIQEQVKSSSFMDVLSKQFGVLRAFNEKEMGYAEYYYFIHLTCQEFFVALYIAKHLSVKPSPHRQQEIERRQKVLSLVQEIAKNRDIRRYEIIWIFLAGLVSSVPEYAKGADYFWDAIIEFPKEDVQALTFHPHLNTLKFKQRLCREAFLTLRHHDSIAMPQRLSELRTHFQYLHLWQGVQQTEALMRTWHDDTHSVAAKAYQNIQQQYQTDALALGFETKPAVSLPTFMMKMPVYRQSVVDLLEKCEDISKNVRVTKALKLGYLGVKDPAIIQDLQDLSHDKEKSVCGASIEALKCLNALTLEMCLELLKNETTAKIYIEIYIALLRIKPAHYEPFLATNAHPDLVYLFISALYFQGAVLVQKEGQLFLNDTLLTADPGMIQSLYSAAEWFTDAMNEYSESIQSMRLPIEAPSITNVLTEDFLTIDLPIDELSELQQWKATIEPSFSILSYRVAIMEQDITLIKKELNRIGQKMESDWERAQEALTGDDVAYIKTFKKHMVQMYIIATVAASGEVQTTLTATTSSVVTVLDTIAGLVPWGGGAVEILSSLIQNIDLQMKQKRMERITHLGDTPEDVAKMATILGQRLLHCLEIEHYVQDGRISRLFNTLSVLTQKYQDGFYNTLFSVLTQNKTETTLSSPSDMEIRAKNDAQLLLSAIMEKDVPHVQENQVDVDCLFLYSAPLLTVIEQIFDRMKTQYCNKHRYKLADIEIKRKADFCAAVANQCQEQAHNAAAHIEDAAKRAVFIEKLATEFNSHRNLLYQSKALNTWSVFGKTTTLSINKDILDPKIMAATYTNALIK